MAYINGKKILFSSRVNTTVRVTTFDLVELGLANVVLDGTQTTLEIDTHEIISALEAGSVRFNFNVVIDEEIIPVSVIPTPTYTMGIWLCTVFTEMEGKFLLGIVVQEGSIVVWFSEFQDIFAVEKQVKALTEKSDKFEAWYDENHYVKMTGTFTATNSGATTEIGGTINSTFTWSFSKLPTSLTVGGVKQTPPTQEGTTAPQTFTASSQTSKSFTISGVYAGTYGNETVSKTWTYHFQNKSYCGYVEKPTTLDGDFIKSLATKEFATSRDKVITLNDGTSGKYIWYAYPTRFGKASFTMGGFAGGFEEPDTISVTNGAGYTEDYYLYRSTEAGCGALKVIVE